DPFCGSGSILVGAAEQGRAATGIDVNPLAVFVARVKLSPLGPADVAAVDAWPVPALRIASKVFEPRILDAVLRLRTLIEERAVTPPRRNFLLLAWLATLQPVGSYFKEGNGIKYRSRQRRPGRYVARPDGQW